MDHPARGRRGGAAALAAGALVLSLCAAALGDDWLYWSAVDDEGLYGIRRSALDGAAMAPVVSGIEGSVDGIAVDAGAGLLYWIERGTQASRVVRARLDGGDRVPIEDLVGFASRLAVHPGAGLVFYTVSGIESGYGVRRFRLPAGEIETIVDRDAYDLAVDTLHDRIYWVEEGPPDEHGAVIWSATLDGSDKRPVVRHTLEHHTTGICLDAAGGRLYWATVDYREGGAQIVFRAGLDGSDPQPVTTANPGLDDWPVYLDVHAASGGLFWVNGEDGVFFRAPADGGEAERLGEDPGPYGPFDLVVVSAAASPRFRRGDADGDGAIDLTDAIATLGGLFLGGPAPPCADAADVNDDGALDIADAIAALGFLFLGSFDIPAPGAEHCGEDPTRDDALGCAEPPACAP